MSEQKSNSKEQALAERLCSLDRPVDVNAKQLAASVSNRHQRIRTGQRRMLALATAAIASSVLFLAWPTESSSVPESPVAKQPASVPPVAQIAFAEPDEELVKAKAKLAAAQSKLAELEAIRSKIQHTLIRERLSRDGFASIKKSTSIQF